MSDQTPQPDDSTDSQPTAEPPTAAVPAPSGATDVARAAAAAVPAQPPVLPAVPQAAQTWPTSYAATPNAIAPVATGGQTSSSAVVALVLSIASWAVCPVVLAIVALVFAGKADREIRESGGRVEGAGLVTAAKIVSWINIGVFAAVLILMFFILIVVLIAGGLAEVVPNGQV